MSYHTKLLLCLLSIFTCLLQGSYARSSQLNDVADTLAFVYASRTGTSRVEIRWRTLRDQNLKGNLEIPSSSYLFTLAETGPYLAFATDDGKVHILNIASKAATTPNVKLELNINHDPILSDNQYALSRSLLWSPDGQSLAFVGHSTTGTESLFKFNVKQMELVNLATSFPIATTMIETSSWSPDGSWLAFVAVPNYTGSRSKPEAGAVSSDGKVFVWLTPGTSTCRLSWSPDNLHLASYTGCFESIGGDSRLVIISFDPLKPQIRATPPLFLPDEDSLHSYWWYGMPKWRNSSTLIAPRRTGPKGTNLAPESFRTQLVVHNIATNIEQPIEDVEISDANPFIQDHWAFWSSNDQNGRITLLKGYNFVTGQFLAGLKEVDGCIVTNTRVAPGDNFLALLDECVPNTEQKPTIRLFNLSTLQEILTIKPDAGEQIIPIGFATFTP